jgi:hypothetical protein
MLKIVLGFIIFAALGLYLISKNGDKIDLGGEKHDTGSAAADHSPAAKPAEKPADNSVAPTSPAPAAK